MYENGFQIVRLLGLRFSPNFSGQRLFPGISRLILIQNSGSFLSGTSALRAGSICLRSFALRAGRQSCRYRFCMIKRGEVAFSQYRFPGFKYCGSFLSGTQNLSTTRFKILVSPLRHTRDTHLSPT
jgi:hypothetical protein